MNYAASWGHADRLWAWLGQHPGALASCLVAVAMLVGSAVGVAWLLRRIPADYFIREPKPCRRRVSVARSVVGVVLIVAGVAMLVLPGQGLLTILIGFAVTDLRVKRRILRALLRREKVACGLNGVRRRMGCEPFELPCDDDRDAGSGGGERGAGGPRYAHP